MYPILTRLGSFFVYSFTAVFAIGLIISWTVTQRQSSKHPLPGWSDAALATLICGWLGARLGFMLLNWSYFIERPFELFHLWQGGLTAYGGLMGGLLGLGLWCGWRKRPFLTYASLFSPALLLLIITGWTACWLEGCAYGAATTLGPLAANLPDTFGIFAVRYQTQLLGILLNTVAFGGLLWGQSKWRLRHTQLAIIQTATESQSARKGKENGRLFPLTLLITNGIHFCLTFLRGDTVPRLAGWRLDSWLAILFAIVGLILLQYGHSQKNTQVGK